jgi:Zn-dependent M32 family carboxypeptidase
MKEKEIIPNETIYFEDKKIKPGKDGKYKCPFRCGRPDYPAPRWKTMAGFLKHLNECPKSGAGLKKQAEAYKALMVIEDKRKQEALASCPQKIGDTIYFVHEVITKPEYVRRGDRMVRMRYEAEKAFHAERIVIDAIDWDGSHGVIFNRSYHPRIMCSSWEDAQVKAREAEKAYKQYLEDCAMCR